jgi:hypothetical protein
MIRIDLKPAPRGKAEMYLNGDYIGVSSEPLFAAARWLLANNKAKPGDQIRIYRDDMLCMSGPVGLSARLTVTEDKRGGMRLSEWRLLPKRIAQDEPKDAPGSKAAA